MRRKGHIYSYILILPALLIFGIFFIAPSIYGVIYSLTDWTIGKDEISFIGFENYRTILQSEELQLAIYNTFLYAVVVVIGKNLNGLLLALAVNTKMKLRGYFRVIFFLPCVISTIIIGLIFVPILHPNGILNEFLNIQVIVGYSLLVITMFLNIIAYRNIEYKLGPIINSLTYVFVLFFGVVIFHEKLSKNKIFGIILILLGIFVFNL